MILEMLIMSKAIEVEPSTGANTYSRDLNDELGLSSSAALPLTGRKQPD